MKILVTGGAGFIASNIADAYIKEGYQVSIVDNLSTGKRSNINQEAKFYNVDITNGEEILHIFEKEKFDIVNHHAAQIDVRKSVADPIFDAQVNILGTLNILENCHKHGIKKVIFASSGGVIYGECSENLFPDEQTESRPLSPYGVTKLGVEYYLKYYRTICNVNYTILRYGNVYGPRQDPFGEAGVVAIFSQAMLKNKDIFIFGDGEQLRDYVYVGDIVQANLLALSNGGNDVFNIGTGITSSVNRLFNELKTINDYNKNPIYKSVRPGELFRSALNINKAKEKLNWTAKTSFKEGLEKTADWFREQQNK